MQRTEKPVQVPDQSKASFPIDYAGLHCLEFRSQRGFSFLKFWHALTQLLQREQALLVCIQQPIRTLLHTSDCFRQSLFANFAGIGLLKLANSSLHFLANQPRIFQKFHHLAPDQIVQIILAHRAISTKVAFGVTPIIRTQAAVVVKLSSRSACRGPVVRIATHLTNEHPLKQRRFFSMPGRKDFVLLQPFLGEGKGLGTHDGRHRNWNPLLSGAVFGGARARGKSATSAQKARDFLSLSLFRFAKTRRPLVSRITQHRPDGASFPKGLSSTRGNALGVKPADNRSDAPVLFSLETVDLANHGGLFLDDFVKRCGVLRLLHVAVTIRRPAKHIHQATLGAVSLSPPRALGNLRPLVLCDHPLKLHQKLFFWRGDLRRLNKDALDSLPGKFLHQQDLVGILAAQSIGRIDQYGLDRSLTSQIPQPLQKRPHQNRSAVAFVLKDPLRWHGVAMRFGILQQRGGLASDGLLFFLSVRGNPRVNGCGFHALELRSNTLCLFSGTESSQEPKADRLERVCGLPSDRSYKATGSAWSEPSQPCPPLFCRKASRARVTKTLKDSPVDLAICLKARTRLKGILTVKTTLRSGSGCIRPTFWAFRRYRNACLLETPYRRINAVTVLALERSLRSSVSAPLIRWVSCVSEDLTGRHVYTTFYVISSSVIPTSLVRDNPFKLEVCDCVGGVISPLLANIYLHLFDRVFLSYCRATGLKAHLVRYADDFVILMRGGMKGTVNQVRQALARMELKLNEEKSRVVDARQGSFDFLGFTFSRKKSLKTGRVITLVEPARKS